MSEIRALGIQSTEMLRYQMYVLAEKHGVSEAARRLETTRKTVRLWRDRYREDKEHGLENKSRIGQRHPLTMPEDIQTAILEERTKRGNPGARTIINNLGLKYSAKSVHKVIKRHGLIQKPKTRHNKRKDMQAVKAAYHPMQKIQLDYKYYSDVANQHIALSKGALPKFEITARDYRAGMVFLGFTNYKDSLSSSIFADYVISYLKNLGLSPSDIAFQTDNGVEFVDPLYNGPTLFEQTLAANGVRHLRIPPAAPTFNSDVESFHNTIEREFLDVENFTSLSDFYVKSFIYQTYYNHVRKIRTRGNSSPVEIFKQLKGEIKPSKLCYIPIFCDAFRNKFLARQHDPPQSGYFKGLPSTISGRPKRFAEACPNCMQWI